MDNLPIGMAATTVNKPPIATKDLPGPPYICPECNEPFTDKRPLGQHRNAVHGYRSPSAIYSHDLYMRKKAEREAKGLPAKSNKMIAEEKTTHERDHSTDEANQLSHHIAFATGYITAFIETYAKGNGLPWAVFASGVAEQLRASRR